MHRIRVGVLRGGPSNEYEVSLQTGASVLTALRDKFADKYRSHDIFIDKAGTWHIDGLTIAPHDSVNRIDVMFNSLHGKYGEDGKVQSLFESHSMPFTGSGSLSSAVGMNKILSKQILAGHGIKTPYWREFASDKINSNADSIVRELFQTFMLPAVVKPVGSGSSVGVSIVRDYADLVLALTEAAKHGDVVLVEEFIPGVEATGGVIEGFRGHELYSLPPIEIRPHSGFFDYEAKYAGKSLEIVPATFSEKIKRVLEELSAKVHSLLGLRHYSRSDFIIHPRRGIYFLEANTLPGLTPESLFPKSLRAVGSDTPEFVDHLISLALTRR